MRVIQSNHKQTAQMIMDTQASNSVSIGQVLSRNELKNIMAGYHHHKCHCYCCENGQQVGGAWPIPVECDGGGGQSSHDGCQIECEARRDTSEPCNWPGVYVCALCQVPVPEEN